LKYERNDETSIPRRVKVVVMIPSASTIQYLKAYFGVLIPALAGGFVTIWLLFPAALAAPPSLGAIVVGAAIGMVPMTFRRLHQRRCMLHENEEHMRVARKLR